MPPCCCIFAMALLTALKETQIYMPLGNFSYFWTRFCRCISRQWLFSLVCSFNHPLYPFALSQFPAALLQAVICPLPPPVTVLWHCQGKLQIELLFPLVTSLPLLFLLHQHPISLLFTSLALLCPNSLSFPPLFFH